LKLLTIFQYHQTNEQGVLLRTGEWGETALQLALRLERSPEMIRALLRGKGQEAIDMNLEEYRFKDYDNEDLHCKDFSQFILCIIVLDRIIPIR
jgi:hypothetical protein